MAGKYENNQLIRFLYNFLSEHEKFIKYCIIGFSGVVLDYLIFLLSCNILGLHYQIANVLGVSSGIINNFLLNTFINFKKKDNLLIRFLQFYAVGLIGMALNAALLFVFVEILSVNVYIAKAINAFIIAIIQYILNKKFSFKDNINLSRRSKEILIIFLTAFLVRSFLGLVFFGSVDVAASTQDSADLLNGGLMSRLPYFPTIHLFLWFGGIINIITSLPATFCQKLIPIIFDSLTAVLIYDILKTRTVKFSFKAGLLYALSPVALIQNSFHGQWDSICLFFLILAFYTRDYFKEKRLKYFSFGVLFGLSFLIKPVTLIFLLVFFKPFPKFKIDPMIEYIRNQIYSFSGLLSVVAAFFSVYCLIGYKIDDVMSRVLHYSNNGFFMFGLPYSHPFDQVAFLKSRFWLIGLIAVIAIFYYFSKIDAFDIILLTFALMIGTCGLAPQYLIWLVPFLLIVARHKLSALYNLIATVFLLLYYLDPLASASPKENMATFATLKSFNWLMPPTFLTKVDFIPYIRLIGDRIIPAVGLLTAVLIVTKFIISMIKSTETDLQDGYEPLKHSIPGKGYTLFVANFWILVFSFYFFISAFIKQQLYEKCVEANNLKFLNYDMVQLERYIFYGNYKEFSAAGIFNIAFILLFAAVIWSLYMFGLSLKQKTGGTDRINIKLDKNAIL